LHFVPVELPKPKNEADFERMCAQIYGVVFKDPVPKINGRRGQAQGGVDIFVQAEGIGRIGIQCKKYVQITLEWKHVDKEVEEADKFGTPINRLLIATTSPNDAALLKLVQSLSDERKKAGKFEVEIEFWEDIEHRINSHAILQDSYNPQAPGAVFHRHAEDGAHIKKYVVETHEMISALNALPSGREDSTNKIITAQLDRTNKVIKEGRYRDALEHVDSVGGDLAPFDDHQKARWHLQRGLCIWFLQGNDKEAAELFLVAAETYPDDERMAAAEVRGLMLKNDIEGALNAGKKASSRFPASLQVWLVNANVRMLAGEQINMGDVPVAFRDEPDILQIVSISAWQYGNFNEAVALAEKASTSSEAGFFTRAIFLSFAVAYYTQDPVLAQFRIVPNDRACHLVKAIEFFEPRIDRLWCVQSDAVADSAVHLGFAYLLLEKPEKALEVVSEARDRGLYSKKLLRVEIQALDESGEDALSVAMAAIADLPPEVLSATCEIAADRGDVKYIDHAKSEAASRFPDNQEVAGFIKGMRWVAFDRAGKRDDAIAEILKEVPDRMVPLCVAARLLRQAHRSIEASEIVDRVVALIESKTDSAERMLAADLLIHFERWGDAALLFEGLLADAGSGPSEIHAKLLECYIESDKRKKALTLLQGLPDGWAENDEMRSAAIGLGQKVGDWKFLYPLAKHQVKKAPSEAVSWLFLLDVMSHMTDPAAFQDKVRGVPEEVSGTIHQVAKLAGLELRYDEEKKGLRRLYRLVRKNQDEPEAFSLYLLNLLTNRLSMLSEIPGHVMPGCSVEVEEVNGNQKETLIVDPSDIGSLPKRDGFFSPDDPVAAALMGAVPGEIVELPMRAGGIRLVKVLVVSLAYLAMAELAKEKSQRLSGLPHMWSVVVGNTGNPEKDLVNVHEEIKRLADESQSLLEIYAKGGLTLSRLSAALGRSPIEVCCGWPRSAPALFVGTGLAQERDSALSMLREHKAVYVVDSTALAELAFYDAGHALNVLPKVLVSASTKEVIDTFLTKVKEDKSIGTAFDDNGHLRLIEFDDKTREAQIKFAEKLAETIALCEVLPAYGDLGDSDNAIGLARVMGTEEKDVVLLAREHGAIVLTLDGRLRMLASHVYEVKGVWPQVLVMRALEAGIVTPREASSFTIREFLSNRKFVSLRSEDVVWMVSQGDSWLQSGISAMKRYKAAPETDMGSVFEMCLGFMQKMVGQLYIQLGAFGEILFHIAEAMFGRSDCPAAWDHRLAWFTQKIILEDNSHGYVLPELDSNDKSIKIKLLLSRIHEAKIRTKEPPSLDPVRVRVLHCAKKPWLVIDRSSKSAGDVGEVTTAGGIKSDKTGQQTSAATRKA
jgi:transcription elongation GreA/GreB family factor